MNTPTATKIFEDGVLYHWTRTRVQYDDRPNRQDDENEDTVMLSEFRRRKLAAGFRELDINGDGHVGGDDVEMLIKNHGDAYGYPEGSPEYAELARRTRDVWEQLKQFDSNGDGAVSLDEYVAGFEAFLSQHDAFMSSITTLVDSFYEIADADRDGRVGEAELVKHFLSWNHTEEQARAAFPRLDRNGNGSISKAEWMTNLEEFYYSEDPEAPGNWQAPIPSE